MAANSFIFCQFSLHDIFEVLSVFYACFSELSVSSRVTDFFAMILLSALCLASRSLRFSNKWLFHYLNL